MNRHISLSETLMNEFCPPLDSSLVAALLVDIEVDPAGLRASPTQSQIHQLRATLRELAAQADESQLTELSHQQLTSPTDASGSSSVPEFYLTLTDASSSSTSSTSFHDSHISQLTFLRAILPDISENRLKDALSQAELGSDEPDLWNVITNLLSDEVIREREERGAEGDDDVDFAWCPVPPRQQGGPHTISRKKKRGRKFTFLDVRQQHHVQHLRSARRPNAAITNPWAVVTSISEHLSQLLPSYPASHFQSYFHSPHYSTPYQALCSALNAMSNSKSGTEDTAVLSNLLEILIPEYEEMLDSEKRSNLRSDLETAVRVTRGHADDALDLVRILRDLDSDSTPGYMEMGVYHSPVQASSACPPPPTPAKQLRIATQSPTEFPPAPISPHNGKPPPTENPGNQKVAGVQWQTVYGKGRRLSNSLATKYDPHRQAMRDFSDERSGHMLRNGKDEDTKELDGFYRRRKECLQERDDFLRDAYNMWRKGNSKSRMGEVAMYLAERARKCQESARKEALNAARAKVQAKRRASQEKDTIDLHGTTAAEAIVIVREELENSMYSTSRPLKIITGRGSHSVNQKSVLKPSVQRALDGDGWSVSTWEGGLIVRGRKT